ncbi:pyridoxal phosphate-dependent aminotransferase [Hymenobacter guriensis]|uniref:Aminotransferase class I/II-fold pyridoxal phosphate-dependent enzyme n=1 Tax=Hymenobacter guriensis TaxID=2793065 RepID=A0ABS0KXB5_9BACT|nr:aminotransferase class I/II-fold pyridoxal phosphate-dependent enzyme [Hymenobacter guriensis]MBG8551983.1 aminotransferase class I/II-fold pyridoxal phosphate-dependent enzyme [Hymenobacter guriensis]
MNSPSLISLASGYVSFPTPAVVVRQLQETLAQPLTFASPVAGLPELRMALAGRYPNVTPEQVLVTPGAKAALYTLLRTVLQPGDEVLLPTPSWFGFDELVRQAGGTLRLLPLSPENNYALEPAAVAQALTPRTRVFLFSNPNNPTGRIYSAPELETVLDVLATRPDVLVVSDEIYERISFGTPVPSLLDFPDRAERHVLVHGFSKSLGLVGWGVGYLIAPPALTAACTHWQHMTAGAVAVPSQLAALAATEAADAIAAELVGELAPRRCQLLSGLTNLGLPCAFTEGTYYAFPDLRAYLDPTLPRVEAAASLVKQLRDGGVEVVDGATCHAPGYARLSCAVPEPELVTALNRLSQVLATLRPE